MQSEIDDELVQLGLRFLLPHESKGFATVLSAHVSARMQLKRRVELLIIDARIKYPHAVRHRAVLVLVVNGERRARLIVPGSRIAELAAALTELTSLAAREEAEGAVFYVGDSVGGQRPVFHVGHSVGGQRLDTPQED